MKNHYVSQFIIKRFSDAINIFDIKSGNIDENKRPHKVFYKENIYEDETEKAFNLNIEIKVANLLNEKIINNDKIVLTRTEIETLKCYMLICSVRNYDADDFVKFLKSFTKNVDIYIGVHKLIDIDYSYLPYTGSLNETNEQIMARALKVFANSKNIRDIAGNKLATREMLGWALPFLESYIAFWDTPDDKEYILTDCGMVSEYEGFHMITGGIDISKMSYILSKRKKKPEYANIFASDTIMYENYSIYNLSSKRCLVMINPFFRLYYNMEIALLGNNDSSIKKLERPDIWPAIIQNKSLFDVPQNKYFIDKLHMTPYDEFIYTPKTLTDEDLIYINSLMLSQTKEIIGFNSISSIVDSIYYYVWFDSNFKSVKKKDESIEEISLSLCENIIKSPFMKLCGYSMKNGAYNSTNFLLLFEKLLSYIYKDFEENKYICEYYLERENDTINCTYLDFLGKGNKKIEYFRKKYNKIMEKETNGTKTIQ